MSFEVYGGPGITKEKIIKNQIENNNRQEKYGVTILGPIQSGGKDAGPFQIDRFDDPETETLNFQTVMIPAPTITGTYEDEYAYFGNNVMTNGDYFLQSGQIYDNSNSRLIWADTTTNYAVQDFNIDYVGGHVYTHYIYYYGAGSGNYKKWAMAVYDNTASDWACHIEPEALSTSTKYDINTSVFFENYNTESDWYDGFSSGTVSATQAWKGYGSVVNGSWTGWLSCWDDDTLYNNIYGAMSGSLTDWGTTYWTLSNIPLGT